MKRIIFLTLLLTGLFGWLGGGGAFAAEKRIALVIGEAAYKEHPLATTANDAGLIAQTLQAAGFDVTGVRDLDEDGLRRALRDFLDKAGASGPETVAFVYFAGLGLQLDGENYLIPVDAAIARDADISLRAARLSDYLKPLAALGLKTTVVVLDAARANPFALAGQPIAGGLALFEPGPNLLLAYNAAPGTIAPAEAGPYGAYAHGLAETIRAGGMPLMQVFDETRLRVSEMTKGAQIPWNSAPINSSFVFFERTAQAPARPSDDAALRAKPIAQLGARDAYAACIDRDTLQGYQEYLGAYPGDPLAKRVRAILAARREALIWRHARMLDTPDSYWSYLRRYPRGPHVADARRLLAMRASALEPPPAFQPVDMGYPPPPPEEIVYLEGPELYFDNPAFGFPPPPPPDYFLPPPPPDFVVLPPPYVVYDPYVLPVPVYIPVPIYIQTPAYIAPPPNNVIFANLHNSVMVDRASNNLVIKNPEGRVLSSSALTAVGAGAAGAAIGAALPHFIAKKPVSAPPAPLPPPAGAAAPIAPARQPPAPGAPPAAHQAQPTPTGPAVHQAKPTPAGPASQQAQPTPTGPAVHQAKPTPAGPTPQQAQPTPINPAVHPAKPTPTGAAPAAPAPAPQAQPARKNPAPGAAPPSRERTREHGRAAPPAPATPSAPAVPAAVVHGSPPPKPPARGPAAPARAPSTPAARPAPPPAHAPTAQATRPAPTKPHCVTENGKQVCR